VAGLTGLFRNEQVPEHENDKLVDLFRNRIALKKEFAALREENYRLQDRIEEQRGSIERVEQKLQHLEGLLLDPEWVHNVAVFYQLRRLGENCEVQLERFAKQLKQQHEERLAKYSLAQWKAELARERAAVEERLNEQRAAVESAEERLEAARDDLESMSSVSRMLFSNSRDAAVTEAETALEEVRGRESELRQELERLEQRDPPAQEGLDVVTKRSVNFLILSFAQQLYLDYLEGDLTNMAREAQQKSVGAVPYGGRQDCDRILECLEKRREEIERRPDPLELLKLRAQMLAEHATFRSDGDAVPAPTSVAAVFDINANGIASQIDANLLGDNFFGIAKYLCR
jgi:chaperonin cofactor prefoldin